VNAEPIIGVSTSEVRQRDDHAILPQGEPPRTELALGERYLEAVRKGGGLPVILAPVRTGAVDRLLDRLDGLCLSGGPDLHPWAYGADEHPELGPTEPELDRFELALARRAVARQMPVLAICRGAQVLNVARGGTLHQHLPDLSSDINHRQDLGGAKASHSVSLDRESKLSALMGGARLRVNSFHHQGVDKLGSGLRVVGKAPDGTAEALEGTTSAFLFAVQWHAECLVKRRSQLALFEGLVSAAADHSARLERAA
jgi:putative glutamine amidotransferase